MELDDPDENGVSLREKLLQVYRSSGIWDPKLDSVDVPAELEFFWRWFWELQGEGHLTYQEIEAYERVIGIRFSPWEVETLMAMSSKITEYTADRIRAARKGAQSGGRQ